jgi:hypothetical protein
LVDAFRAVRNYKARAPFWTPAAGVWQNAAMDALLRWFGLHKAWNFGFLPGFLFRFAFLPARTLRASRNYRKTLRDRWLGFSNALSQ